MLELLHVLIAVFWSLIRYAVKVLTPECGMFRQSLLIPSFPDSSIHSGFSVALNFGRSWHRRAVMSVSTSKVFDRDLPCLDEYERLPEQGRVPLSELS